MRTKILVSLVFLASFCGASEFNPAMKAYIAELKAQAKASNANFTDFDASRGEQIFRTTNKGKDGEILSCQSCHNANLKQNGKNVFTGKTLAPLAPSANPQSLSEVKNVQKWLKRNFKDVFLREGTAQEKGDVLYYLIKQ